MFAIGVKSYPLQTEKANKDDVIPVFMDTLAEDGDLYRFLDDIEKKLDIKIIRLCNGNTPLGLAFDKKFLWNSRIASVCNRCEKLPSANNDTITCI